MSSYQGYLCVLGGASVHLVLGTLYLFANMTTAVTAHLRKFDGSITYQGTLLCFATALGAQGCTMLLGGLIEKRFGARKTVLLGGYILVLGTFLASTATSLAEFICFNGAMFGAGLGICYSAPIMCACKWLPHRRGLVTGCIVAGFGFGAFVFGLVATTMLNPHRVNLSDFPDPHDGSYFASDSEVPNNVPHTFCVLGTCYFFLVSFAGWCLREPTEAEEAEILLAVKLAAGSHDKLSLNESISGTSNDSRCYHESIVANPLSVPDNKNLYQKADANDADSSLHISNSTSSDAEVTLACDVSPWELIRRPLGWHLSSCMICCTVGGMYLAGTFKTYGQEVFKSDVFLSTVSSLSSIFNAIGRIFWGALADRFGPLKTLTALTLVFAIIIVSYASSPLLGGEIGFTIWTFLIFFFEGGNFALFPAIVMELFGVQNAGANYAIIFSLYSVCVVLNITTLAHYSVSFESACESMSILTFLGFLNLLLFDSHLRKVCKKHYDR